MTINFSIPLLLIAILSACNGGTDNTGSLFSGKDKVSTGKKFTEGLDYQVYERVRMVDSIGFTSPQEAYSVLLPKGWISRSNITWNQPGSSCSGTFASLKAASADGSMTLEMFPSKVFSWSSDPLARSLQQPDHSRFCEYRQPVNAETYLREIFLPELGNPEVVKSEPNTGVINTMQERFNESRRELQQYGAGKINFIPEAVNAVVRWKDGKEGMVTVGVENIETVVPNVYNGSYTMVYTTQISNRTVFTYPAAEGENARSLFSVIMLGIRTNPYWRDAVNDFWKQARQGSHRQHLAKIKAMDEQTARIGKAAIASGQQRLRDMDNQLRSWEQQQQSQDRMHTEFIKTIREVENYRDETGKYEMSAGYNHAWSRGDGNSFILSDNPNFDPSSVFQDQRWKEMKKVR